MYHGTLTKTFSNLCTAALPVYVPRQSLKDLKKAGADSKKLRASLSAAKSHSRAFKRKPAELKRQASDS